ncbi:hypothetical protein Lal_00032495 [Lupinus albus]|nr:hypothetical protein Lal_00032495 [Lupinus albus]
MTTVLFQGLKVTKNPVSFITLSLKSWGFIHMIHSDRLSSSQARLRSSEGICFGRLLFRIAINLKSSN